MADFEINFNSAALLDGAEAAFKDFNLVLGRQFQRRITDTIWPWPSGDSPRDIVDLGQLRDSYDMGEISPTEFQHEWDTEYAMAVHEGAVREAGTVNVKAHWRKITKVGRNEVAPRSRMISAHTRRTGQTTVPARPWVRVTLRGFNSAAAFARLAAEEMRKRTPP